MGSFNRTNLRYEILPKKEKRGFNDIAERILKDYRNKCGIVYCFTKKECDQCAEELSKQRILVSLQNWLKVSLSAIFRDHCCARNCFHTLL